MKTGTWNPKSILIQSTAEKQLETITTSTDQPTNNDTESPEPEHGVAKLIVLHTFSTIQRLLRVTAWVLRFVNNVKKKKNHYGTLSVSELNSVQTLWIINYQSAMYPTELANLQANASSRLPLERQLRLFLVKDIIRFGGRIHNAPLHESAKFPILLPQNHHLTKLIVRDAHERTLHSGLNSTLTHLRQRYWIPTGRQYVKKIIRRCVTCRKTIGKVYICLFTCASTRAVRLEVVNDLTLQTFIEAFHGFASRK